MINFFEVIDIFMHRKLVYGREANAEGSVITTTSKGSPIEKLNQMANMTEILKCGYSFPL